MNYKSMTKISGAFSFAEKITIYCGALANRIGTIFNRDIIYDYSVVLVAKRSGSFKLINRSNTSISFSLDSCNFCIRKKTSDSAVFNQVILNKEYQSLIEILKNNNVSTIIDAGANAGYTSLFLNKHFPSASIFAIEPSVSNREILKKNIEINNLEKTIKILPFGLWSENKMLKESSGFRDNKEWSYKVGAAENGAIEGRTLLSLIQENNITDIDILKVDIEGAEKQLFESPDIVRILSKTKSIAIETHKEIGIDKLISINDCLNNAGFSLFTIGECTFGINRNFTNA